MNRTYIVATRVSENQLNTTYINLDPSSVFASIVTVVLREQPFRPVGLTDQQIPEVGHTVTHESIHGKNG